MSSRQTLKKLLERNRLLVAPGCFDGLSARLVEEAGFEAAYLSGGAVARSMGIPDIGLVTMSEAIERAAQVVAAIKIPIIADADTGYGNAVNLVRTVREFEAAGAAGPAGARPWPGGDGGGQPYEVDLEDLFGGGGGGSGLPVQAHTACSIP